MSKEEEDRPNKKLKNVNSSDLVDISKDDETSSSSSSGIQSLEIQEAEDILSEEHNLSFFQGEKKVMDVLKNDYVAMERSIGILQKTLRSQAKLVLRMKANPYLDLFKLSCKPFVLDFLQELESCEENDLFFFQGSRSVLDALEDAIKLNDEMTKLICGLFTDFSNPIDVVRTCLFILIIC